MKKMYLLLLPIMMNVALYGMEDDDRGCKPKKSLAIFIKQIEGRFCSYLQEVKKQNQLPYMPVTRTLLEGFLMKEESFSPQEAKETKVYNIMYKKPSCTDLTELEYNELANYPQKYPDCELIEIFKQDEHNKE